MNNTSNIEVLCWFEELERFKNSKEVSVDFLKPFHLVTLPLFIQQTGLNNVRLPKYIEKYAVRMGLWDAIGVEPPHAVNYYSEEGNFIPIQKFISKESENERWDKLDRLVTELLGVRFVHGEVRESLRHCLLEIVSNFFDHAEARDSPCLLAAQSWQKGNLVQIAIADTELKK